MYEKFHWRKYPTPSNKPLEDGINEESSWPLHEHENLHFDSEQDIHTNSKTMREVVSTSIHIC